LHDVLYMTWNCPDCSKIKTEFEDFGIYAFDDDAAGCQDQNLIVIQTYSNVAARYALQQAGLGEDVFTPALVCCDESVLTDVDKIIEYLKENYK
jgi:cobalamin biosynthesis Co2+ chelatase CbiK